MSSIPAALRRVLPENPFVGLRCYESNESILFFGRQVQALELLDRLHQNRFVSVVGSSGCGKSSLVRAGLIPNLKAGFLANEIDRWNIATMKPGDTPLYGLAAALTEHREDGRAAAEALLGRIREEGLRAVTDHLRCSAAQENVLLLVDQFEEIFRCLRGGATADQIDDATDFVSIMLKLAEQSEIPVYVVMSMRTDFLGDCDIFFGLPEALNRSQYLVPRLTRQQRREVIEGPINLYGREIRPELLDRLLNEAGERSDQLPVLQHALMLMWREFHNTGDDSVGLTHYDACGGIAEALKRHAEEAMRGMTKEQERLTERIFRMLTDTDEHGRRIRRPVRLSQLTAVTGAQSDQILHIIERFRGDNRSFLIVSDTETLGDPRIDISHEALFRQWKRLEDWVQAEGDSKEQYLRLVQSARLHRQEKEVLMVDPALQVAENWRAAERPTGAWAARYGGDFRAAMAYLDESLQKRERDSARRGRKRRLSIAGAALVAVVLIGYFWLQSRNAERAALFGAALSAEDPLMRALLAAEFGDTRLAVQAVDHLQQVATTAIPVAVFGQRQQKKPDATIAASFEPGTDDVLTVAASGLMQRWRADGRGHPITVQIPASSSVSAVAFSPNHKWVVAGFETGDAWIGGRDGSPVSRIAAQNGSGITALAFGPDSEQILAGYADYSVRIWRRDGTLVRSLGDQRTKHNGPISAAQFDMLGTRALTASWDRTARVWDVNSGRHLAVVCSERPVHSAAFSDDGTWVVCGYDNGYASISKSDGTGDRVALSGHKGRVTIASFSRDGSKVVTGSDDKSALLWRLGKAGGSGPEQALIPVGLPAQLSGHAGAVRAVTFSPDMSKLVTASDDGTARLWSSESREPRVLGQHRERVQSVAFSPDGNKVVSSSYGTTQVWSSDGRADPLVIKGATNVRSVAFSPNGTKIVAGSEDGMFSIWNLSTGRMDFRQELSDVLSVAFTPDAASIITGTRDNRARVWALDVPREPVQTLPLLVLEGHEGWVSHAAFSPDVSRIVTASMDNTARVWSVHRTNGTLALVGQPAILPHGDRVLSAAFSPDGSMIATASADRKARLWKLSRSGATLLKDFPHADEVWQAAFSADGKRLLTASTDKAVRIWDIKTGQTQLELSHGSGVRAAAFRPKDDSLVVTGAEDGVVRLWRTNARDLIEYLRSASTACLTPGERVRYLGESETRAQDRSQACEVAHGRPAQSSQALPGNYKR